MPWRFSYIYLGANLVLIGISSFMGGLWLLNTQLAFICSMLITFSSFYAYGRMVNKRLDSEDVMLEEERDEDDPYGLYVQENQEESKDFKTMVKEEKAKLKSKGNSTRNALRSLSGLFFPYRLVAYGFLVIVFLYLQRQGLFEVAPFLLGLAIVPLSSLVLPWLQRE
jgi:Ca2+/Na+ antiporter